MEHGTDKERLRQLSFFSLERRRLRDISWLSDGESIERTETDSSEKCTMTGQKAKVLSFSKRNSV